MRILFLAPHPFFVERGTPIAVRQAVTVLCEQGHEVDLLTYHEGAEVEIPGARILRIRPGFGISNVPIGFSAKKLVCDAWLAAAALRQVRQGDYDVVHAVEEAVFIALACRAAGKFRVVYDMDSLMPDQIAEKWPAARVLLPPLQWFERQAIRRADLILPVCQAIAERAEKATSAAKVHLLPDVAFAPDAPDGCEIEDLRTLFVTPAPLALYVGNLERYQGIDLLLEAFRRLPPEEACNLAVIGGTPEMVSGYRAKTSGLKIAERVRFLGQRNLDALGAYLAQADILCSPRLKGVNTPMKVYGYMASGRAILATDILSHSQVLDSECAVLARPDPQSICDGLRVLIRDGGLRARLGTNAATRARELYGPAAFARRLERAYATISPVPATSVPDAAALQ